MIYIIIELQKSNNGSVSIVPPSTFTNQAKADQAYHTALASAAVSNVDVHSVIMLNDTGDRVKGETYYHGEAPAAE